MEMDPPGTTSLGERLRNERLRRGLRLDEITAETRIRKHHIEAIEQGQFDLLPRGAYRCSFVAQYARALGLDANEIAASWRQQYEGPPVALPQPRRNRRSKQHGVAWIAAVLAAGGSAYYLRQNEKAAQPVNWSVTEAPSTRQLAQTSRIPPSHQQPAQQADQTQQAQSPVPQSPLPSDSGVHVTLSASEPVWVEVKSDGLQVYSGMVNGSQLKEFKASDKLTAVVGNAAGVTFTVNGKPFGPEGARGEVDVLEFTAAGSRIVSRRLPPKVFADRESKQ